MKVHNIIAGTRRTASQYYEVKSPYDDQIIGDAPKTSVSEVNEAIKEVVPNQFPIWKRAEMLDKIAEDILESKSALASILTAEVGKPMKAAIGEVEATALRFKYAAAEARLLLHGDLLQGDGSPDKAGLTGLVERVPYGKVVAIVPFNYPMATTAAKVAPALAAGNAVIVKSSTLSALSTLKLMEFIAKYFDGSVSAVNAVSDGAKALLITHNEVDVITFTGSTNAGMDIAQKATMKKLILEMGGKGLAIVLPDADPELAAKEIVKGGISFSGQRCDAIQKVIAHEDIYERLVAEIRIEMGRYKAGDPGDPLTTIGPLISTKAVEKVDALVKQALGKGATLLTGGEKDGNIYYPTLLKDITKEMDISKEEIFGPVVTTQSYLDMDELLEEVYSTNYALDSAIFSKNLREALNLAHKLPDATVTINKAPSHGIGYFAFGGNLSSGFGREGIRKSIMDMTKEKTIIF